MDVCVVINEHCVCLVSQRPQGGGVKNDTQEVLFVRVENVSLFTTKNNAQVKLEFYLL